MIRFPHLLKPLDHWYTGSFSFKYYHHAQGYSSSCVYFIQRFSPVQLNIISSTASVFFICDDNEYVVEAKKI